MEDLAPKSTRGDQGKVKRTQERYKKNYDQRLRRQSEVIKEDDYVYLRIERRDDKLTRHKLAPVAEGPYQVIQSTGNTVVIERPDSSVERVSRDRVVLAPQPRTQAEIQDVIRPMTDEELIPTRYPVEVGLESTGRHTGINNNNIQPEIQSTGNVNESRNGEENTNNNTDNQNSPEQ